MSCIPPAFVRVRGHSRKQEQLRHGMPGHPCLVLWVFLVIGLRMKEEKLNMFLCHTISLLSP